MSKGPKPRIIFITGTDTDVGKTVLTASLLHYLRNRGVPALAMKPFCSDDRRDAHALAALQPEGLTLDESNPFTFREPVAPLVAARRRGQAIFLAPVLKAIRHVAGRCPVLLIEGAGGLLSPLGEGFSALELIQALGAEVVVAAANRLGVINHARLTVRQLQVVGAKKVSLVVLDAMEASRRVADPSTDTNARVLAELLAPVQVVELPFLGREPTRISALKKNAKKVEKSLARLLA